MLTRLSWVLCSVGDIGTPLLLLCHPQAAFNQDWTNNLWFAAYFAEHLRQHHTVPEVLHAAAAVGWPQPVFYGYLLYPILGVLSSWTGANIGLRIACAAVVAIEFAAIWTAGSAT